VIAAQRVVHAGSEWHGIEFFDITRWCFGDQVTNYKIKRLRTEKRDKIKKRKEKKN
jgi:hypothetical protein